MRDHASRTAEQNALFRALESSQPADRRLFDDPLAAAFLRLPLGSAARLARLPGFRGFVPWFIDHRWPGVRSCVVARTWLIDAAVADGLAQGAEQLVILGAGFDSRAYRLPGARAVRVFEVDHPATQAAKRRVLARALPAPPEHVCFVATDFQQRSLDAVMQEAGFSFVARSLILWEGTTNYLTEAAVDATLRWCSRAAPGSRLLFTYIHRDVLTNPEKFVGTRQLFAALEKVGERFTWGMLPGELPRFLEQRGLLLESDVGAAEFRRRAFGNAASAMRGHEFYRVATCSIGRPA